MGARGDNLRLFPRSNCAAFDAVRFQVSTLSGEMRDRSLELLKKRHDPIVQAPLLLKRQHNKNRQTVLFKTGRHSPVMR